MDRKTAFKPDGQAPFIFACCSGSDEARVFPIIETLHEKGWHVWFADKSETDESIAEHIKNCEVFLLFLTKKSAADACCRRELNTAVIANKKTVVCRLDPETEFDARLDLKLGGCPQTDPEGLEIELYRSIYDSAESDSAFGGEVMECRRESASEAECSYGGFEDTFGKAPAPYISAPAAVPYSAGAPADKKPVKVSRVNKVDFSVVTDEAVKRGKTSCVDVFMYTKSQRGIVDRALKDAAGRKTEAAKSLIKTSVRQGSAVTVVLYSDDAAIENNSETLVWTGDALDFKFRFSVPQEFKKRSADFVCNIMVDGIHITRLYFSVKLNSSKTVPVNLVRKDSRKAFVSYSHEDKQQVVDRLTAIQDIAPKLRFWMDNQSIGAGEIWRDAIKNAIKKADVFLLFWSNHSRTSSEVEKEWRYALELERGKRRRKSGFITPVALEKPSDCPPPAELADIHFGDPAFDSDIEDIEKVRFINGVKKQKRSRKPKNIRFIG